MFLNVKWLGKCFTKKSKNRQSQGVHFESIWTNKWWCLHVSMHIAVCPKILLMHQWYGAVCWGICTLSCQSITWLIYCKTKPQSIAVSKLYIHWRVLYQILHMPMTPSNGMRFFKAITFSFYSHLEPTSHFTCRIGTHYETTENKLHFSCGFP